MDSVLGGDWFDTLASTGQVYLQTQADVKKAQAQYAAAPALAAAAYANQTAALNNALAWSNFSRPSGLASFTSGNGLLLIMLGLVAFFIINQANK